MEKLYLIRHKILTLPESNIFAAENKHTKQKVIIKISPNKLIDEFELAPKLNINYIKDIEHKEVEEQYIIEFPCDNMVLFSQH